ncbi:MAG: hypothetical protein U9P63_02900 [Patescibacteria group bacterium]|nr:hypothetical protein [Patescibacteria group bacterium]
MTSEKWENLVGNIKDDFKVEEHKSEHFDEHGGTDIESIIFKSPLGRTKLEFITKPVVLDKKTIYSRRIGSGSAEEYIYSKDEKSHKMTASKWDENENEWVEINADNFE